VILRDNIIYEDCCQMHTGFQLLAFTASGARCGIPQDTFSQHWCQLDTCVPHASLTGLLHSGKRSAVVSLQVLPFPFGGPLSGNHPTRQALHYLAGCNAAVQAF
jgi:hypothetical protein